MRKSMLYVTAGCVLASLLFFLAPVFRQAFSVSLLSWQTVFKQDRHRLDPQLATVEREAEQNHDAEGLAFVAMRHPEPSESQRLADKAVQLDPRLTWVYAAVSIRHYTLCGNDRWVAALEKFDPQNALPYFMVAEKNDIDEFDHPPIPHRPEDKPAVWKEAMAAAFQSPKLEGYSAEQEALDRSVLRRYRLNDPSFVTATDWYYETPDHGAVYDWLPSYSIGNSGEYSELLLSSAKALEAQGDNKGASERYFTILRSYSLFPQDHHFWWLRRYAQQAYAGLASIGAQSNRSHETELYSFLADQQGQALNRDRAALIQWRRRPDDQVASWSAALTRNSGFVMLVSVLVLLVCAAAVVVRAKSLRLSMLRPGPLVAILGVTASAALFVSSLVLRLSYQPYAEIFQRFVHDGDASGLANLSSFVARAHYPLGIGHKSFYNYSIEFWSAVLIACTMVFLFAVSRLLYTRLRHTPA